MKIKGWTDDYFQKGFTGIIEWSDGTHGPYDSSKILFLVNGGLHNENGPAIDRIDGRKQWWLNNEYYWEERWKVMVEELQRSRSELISK